MPPSPSEKVHLNDPGALISAAWTWYKKHLRTLIPLGLLASVPILFALFTPDKGFNAKDLTSSTAVPFFIGFIAGLFSGLFIELAFSTLGALLIYHYVTADQEQPSMKGLMKKAMGSFWRYLGATMVMSVIVFGGMILLIIPGIYWSVTFGFAPLLTVVENKTIGQALRRSKELVHGYWWDIFLRILIMGFITIGLAVVIAIPLSIIIAMLHSAVPHAFGHVKTSVIVQYLTSAAVTPLSIAYNYFLFQNLRRVKVGG